MASWEDGPEYAPLSRPDHFAEPTAAPLSAAPPASPPRPDAPLIRPAFDHPQAPVAALETLVPPVPDVRDPQQPFAVASATVTDASSAWSAAHWNPPSGPPVGAPATAGSDPSPAAFPTAFPTASPVVSPVAFPSAFPSAPAPLNPSVPTFPPPDPSAGGPFPAPGTTQWFQPPPAYAPAPTPTATGPSAIAQALTLGVIITLAVGGVVWPLAPVAFGIAFGLAARVRAGRPVVLGIFTAAAGVLVVVGLVSALFSDGFFSDFWDPTARWAQVLCWVVLVGGWIAVWRTLRSEPTRPGPPPTVWG